MLKYFIYKKLVQYKRYKFRQQRSKEGTFISKEAQGYENVFFEGENGIPERCKFSGNIKIGKFTTLGVNNFLHGNIEIGKYCQIGVDVSIHTTNHPIYYLSTYINKRLFNGELAQLKETKKTIIGNDVWVGHGAIILGGIKIGNGAIIAAGSVVTKDIPSYAIVAGTPAKVLKFRFEERIIEEIEELKWWDLNKNELQKIKPLFFKNLSNKTSLF
ncbi:CatB-related O-acetyltransferase [Polaribacter batillariae]|uniref:CatB-related O-acetyltransferase n=1 Tax=Polaribacter batillariae TaxID=2808900 RepID=A0ABX7STI4_9FLAO|nr:CatB-related O-acetyltransferase [Polaribacter batillariae]QTD37562.1 CatB-related O-acetyltransferase [Polaribacter batillariae]